MSKGPQSHGEVGKFSTEDFVTDEITGINAYTFADRVKDRLKEIGLEDQSHRPKLEKDHIGIFPNLKPGDYFNGRLPVVIRKLTLDQLSALYSLFTAWHSYLIFQTNLIAAELSEASTQKEFLWSHLRKQLLIGSDGKKNTPQTMSDMARGDYRFVHVNAKYEELQILYDCMQAALTVAKQDMKMISREVTINQTKLEEEAVGANFGKRFKWSKGQDNYEENPHLPAETRRVRITRP